MFCHVTGLDPNGIGEVPIAGQLQIGSTRQLLNSTHAMITTIGPRTEGPSWRCEYPAAGILTRQRIRREPEGLMLHSAAEVEPLESSTVLAASRESTVKLSALRVLIVEAMATLPVDCHASAPMRTLGAVCANGVEALKLAHAFQPEFVLVEASLPDLAIRGCCASAGVISSAPPLVASVSGYCTVTNRRFRELPVAFSTCRSPRNIAEIEALLAGFDATVEADRRLNETSARSEGKSPAAFVSQASPTVVPPSFPRPHPPSTRTVT
jgi:hypothetical protein